MFQKNKFRAAIVRAGMTIEELAKIIEMNASTLHRKMNGDSDFTRIEIKRICKVLHIENDEMIDIFFA